MDEYEGMKATIDILSDHETMENLRKSKEDIKTGRVKKWSEFVKEMKT